LSISQLPQVTVHNKQFNPNILREHVQTDPKLRHGSHGTNN